MAQLPTDDVNARSVLKIFAHFGSRPGEVIRPNNINAIIASRGLRKEDVARGLDIAKARGWVEDGPNGSVRLTQAGFDQI